MAKYKVVEKQNPLVVYGYFYSKERAENWIKVEAKCGCENGWFMDKTLTPESFKVMKCD